MDVVAKNELWVSNFCDIFQEKLRFWLSMKLLEMKTWKMKAETGHPCDSSTDEGSENSLKKLLK